MTDTQYAAITHFLGGEISPRCYGRVDLEVYRNALKRVRNFLITPQGSAKLRPGIKHLIAAEGDTCRLFRMRTLNGEDYVAVITEDKVKVYTRNGELLEDNATYQMLQNRLFFGGWANWTQSNRLNEASWSTDLSKCRFVLVDSGVSLYAYSWLTVTRESSAVYQSITTATPTNALQLTVTVDEVAVPPFTEYAPTGQNNGNNSTATRTAVVEIWNSTRTTLLYSSSRTSAGVITLNFTPGVGNGTFVVMLRAKCDHAGNGYVHTTRITFKYLSLVDTVVTAPLPIEFNQTAWTEAQLNDIQADYDVATQQLVLVHGNVDVRVLKKDVTTNVWSFGTPTWTNKPAQFASSNFPSTVAFHEGRLWLGSTPKEGATLWASKTGAAFNFTVGTLAADSLKFDVIVSGRIQFMTSNRILHIGSTEGDVVLSSEGGVVTPSDYSFRRHTGVPSARVKAIAAGNTSVYLNREQRLTRALHYDGEVSLSWKSENLNLLSEHLLIERALRFSYAVDPHSSLALVTSSGNLAVIMFDVFSQAVRTAMYWNIAGDVQDVVHTFDNTSTLVWVAVRVGGSTLIGYLDLNEDGVCLDAWGTATANGSGSVSGLSRFEGASVSVVIDPYNAAGNCEYVGDYPVASGAIALGAGYANKTVHVGLKYPGEIRTLKPEGLNPNSGSSQQDAARWGRVMLRVNESALPVLNGNRAQRPEDVTPSSTGDDADTIMTGDLYADVEGYTDELTITQDIPLRTEICAIFPKMLNDRR